MRDRKLIYAGLVSLALIAGALAGRYLFPAAAPAVDTQAGKGEPLYWVAPMDPDYRRDKPGKSPMGMDLVPVYAEDLADESEDTNAVRIDPSVVNNLGVRTASVGYGQLHRPIDTVGYVTWSEDALEHIHPRVEGWIEALNVKAAGDSVNKGEPLFTIYSRELVSAQEEFLSAQRFGNRPLLEASRERLASLGMTTAQINRLARAGKPMRTVSVDAPISGVVADLAVREGMFIRPGTEVMSLAGTDDVWILADVFEREASAIAPGQRADIEFAYLPGETREAIVDYVYPELDPKTRTVKVRMRLDNPGVALKPNMFASVRIHAESTAPSVHIPQQALIRGAVNRVVIATGEGRFRSVPVRVGVEAGDRVQIIEGLSRGDRVVTSGQFLIDSESSIDAETLRGTESESMDHESMDHESMDHESMDHESMDHESMDHESMDHESMDHESMDHESMDHESMDHGPADDQENAP